MNLLQKYACSSGLKADKPHVTQKFFPISIDKYITLHQEGSVESKRFSYWTETISILHPILKTHGIGIVQIGSKNDAKIPFTYHTSGQTNLNQAAYLVNKGLLHLGVDSFPVHLAGAYNKPIVALYSNSYKEQSGPYWGDKSKQILIQAPMEGKRPSYSNFENPKTIDRIKPEEIAAAVCKLLEIPFNYEYETLFISSNYSNFSIDIIPDTPVDTTKIASNLFVVRLDLHFNEKNLVEQLKLSDIIIITDKPIDSRILSQFRTKIKEVYYLITDNNNPNFVKNCIKLNIPIRLMCYKDNANINDYRLKYMDLAAIHEKHIPKVEDFKEFSSLSDEDKARLYYKSSKFYLSQGKIFPSKMAWKQNRTIDKFFPTLQKLDEFTEDLMEEIHNIYVVKRTN